MLGCLIFNSHLPAQDLLLYRSHTAGQVSLLLNEVRLADAVIRALCILTAVSSPSGPPPADIKTPHRRRVSVTGETCAGIWCEREVL